MKFKIATDSANRWVSQGQRLAAGTMQPTKEILPPPKFSVPRHVSALGNDAEFVAPSSGKHRQCVLLSPRENEVIRCFAQGLLYKETADALRISYSAVHKHQHKAFLKLGATNRSEAIRKWWDMGAR